MIIRTNIPKKYRQFNEQKYETHAVCPTNTDAQIEKKRLQKKGYFVRITQYSGESHYYNYVIWKRMPLKQIHPMDWHTGVKNPRVIGRK